MARIGYVRVSTVHQNTQRQEYAMPTDLDKVFTDKEYRPTAVSGNA